MSPPSPPTRQQWSSQSAFVLAAAGAAVGLGNFWRFPHLVHEHGGGAFLVIFLVCLLVVGWPLLIAETAFGRRTRRNPVDALDELARTEGRSPNWRFVGGLGLITGFVILSYYGVVAGWVLAYAVRSAVGVFDRVTEDGAGYIFSELLADPERLLAWHSVFLGFTAVVVMRGVRRGVEQAVRVLMPLLFFLLMILVAYAATRDGFQTAVRELFMPVWADVDGSSFLAALGQAFFTLGVGTGSLLIYGSYLPKGTSLIRPCASVLAIDFLVGILIGLVIYTVVVDQDLESVQGPRLLFETLPVAFGQVPGGRWLLSALWLVLACAAWTSAIALTEPLVAWVQQRWGVRRPSAGVLVLGGAWLLGDISVVSLNLWSDISVFGMSWFRFFDQLAANTMLPLSGLLIAVFGAWILSRDMTRLELGLGRPGFAVWWFTLRYLTTGLMIVVLLDCSGALSYLKRFFLGF